MNRAIEKRNLILPYLFIFLFFACTKIVTTDIGGGLIPPVDNVTTKEMYLDVSAKNSGDDSVRVRITDIHALGYVNDPLFGTTTAAINVQIKPITFPFSFEAPKDSVIFDSVVLVLGYAGAWGDTDQNMSFRVYEISAQDSFSADSVYPNTAVFHKQQELTEAVRTVRISDLNDSLTLFQEKAANQLRIRLNANFGNTLLKDFDTSHAYKSDSLFDIDFRGFQVVPEPSLSGNALLRINLLDTNTKVAIYYRFTDTAGKADTTVAYFRTTNYFNCASSNYIKRERSTGAIAPYFDNGLPEDSLLFVDANPGAFSTIQLKGLEALPNMIIHRAELLMEQVPNLGDVNEEHLTPPNLFLAAYSEDSMRRFVIPKAIQFSSSGLISNLNLFGCFPIPHYSGLDATYSYNFDLTRYIQSIVTNRDSAHNLILYAPFNDYIYVSETSQLSQIPISVTPLNDPAMGRVRLGGGNHSAHKMRLHIVYSLL